MSDLCRTSGHQSQTSLAQAAPGQQTTEVIWCNSSMLLTATCCMCCGFLVQAAILRKEGRLQIMGPNINIPKKQLRAQWPAVLERMSPQDVQAHIFIDSADQYISCAAKIILTKAKVSMCSCANASDVKRADDSSCRKCSDCLEAGTCLPLQLGT